MSSPGWYPDPHDPGQQRFWNGSQWTDQTHTRTSATPPPSPEVSGTAQPWSPDPSPPATRRTNAPLLWVAAIVAVTLLLSAGWWVFLGRHTAPEEASPQIPVTPSLIPSPTVTAPMAANLPVTVGDAVTGETSCPIGAAASAKGELDEDGKLASAAGVRIPLPDGFEPRAVPYGFVHESNSAVKLYDNGWMSTVTLGHIEAEEGFDVPEQNLIRVARCILGDKLLYRPGTTGKVIGLRGDPRVEGAWLEVEIPVTGVDGVAHDTLSIGTLSLGGRMTVVIVVAADHDPGAATAIWNAINQMEETP